MVCHPSGLLRLWLWLLLGLGTQLSWIPDMSPSLGVITPANEVAEEGFWALDFSFCFPVSFVNYATKGSVILPLFSGLDWPYP